MNKIPKDIKEKIKRRLELESELSEVSLEIEEFLERSGFCIETVERSLSSRMEELKKGQSLTNAVDLLVTRMEINPSDYFEDVVL